MNALVGYTGFVGSNLYAKGQFDAMYNSKNIASAYDTRPELLVYAGLRAEKYLANQQPKEDLETIWQAQDNIRKIDPGKLVFISTIDVFSSPIGVNEDSEIETRDLCAYGYNRYQLELWVRENFPDALIIRLPGLFGEHLKKNFIYDFIHLIPSMLREDKFEALAQKDSRLKNWYIRQSNGFYKANIPDAQKDEAKAVFRKIGFTALQFTDSRSQFQFYNLANLWRDMNTVLDAGIRLWHPATEPVKASELYQYLTGESFLNELPGAPANYDYRTVHDRLFGGEKGYIQTKEEVMQEIQRFIEGQHV